MHFTEEQLVAACIEWTRRYRTAPETFLAQPALDAMPVEQAGKETADYIVRLMEGKQ